jgi:hypothetical protein
LRANGASAKRSIKVDPAIAALQRGLSLVRRPDKEEDYLKVTLNRKREPLSGVFLMDITTLVIQLVSGALGGNAAASVSKDDSLGTLGNTIVGALGGGVGGHFLGTVLGLGGTAAASGMDVGTIVSAFLTGGVAGGVTTLVLAFLKSRMTA